MTILDQLKSFEDRYGRQVLVNKLPWRYYRLGTGTPILWLTGGLRRSGLGFDFMQRLSACHTVIAPDYPPVMKIDDFMQAFDLILETEGIRTFAMGGQSYGGMLAQAYLAHRGPAVDRLILSSTGPSDWGRIWALVDYILIGLARLLPEKTVKGMLLGGLLKFVTIPEAERKEWQEALTYVMEHQLTRADVISHFAAAADLIGKGMIRPPVFRDWHGRVVVLSAENDITQSKKDFSAYEKLFGRPVELINMGDMGHTAALFDPAKYVELLEQAL